ncbi:MAG TPA: hypothetical protein DCL80_09715 [Balneola sp.]|nr:hypothetical protein [Balneola sp.]
MKKRKLLFLLPLFVLLGCEYKPTSGEEGVSKMEEVDFSQFYVIGGTYSSGFMDGALYNGGQQYSFPNLFSERLNEIYGQETFVQAEVESELGLNQEDPSIGKFLIDYPELNTLYPYRSAKGSAELSDWEGSNTELNDYSFPFLNIYEVDDPSLLANNRYYNRISGLSGSLVDEVIQKQPTAVILDLGMDDILQYALNGASGSEFPNLGTIAKEDIIQVSDYRSEMETIVNRLLNETNADVFIMDTFDPLRAPFFNTIGWTLELEIYNRDYIFNATDFWEDFNFLVYQFNFVDEGGVPASQRRPRINFDQDGFPGETSRARVIFDEELNSDTLSDGTVLPKYRQLLDGEFVLYDNLPNLNIDSPLSATVALADNQALTLKEMAVIRERSISFNEVIHNIASGSNRINVIKRSEIVQKGFIEALFYDGVSYTADFSIYSIFSSDGYTLNKRGNAFVANELIKLLNDSTSSNIKLMNPNLLEGNEIKTSF